MHPANKPPTPFTPPQSSKSSFAQLPTSHANYKCFTNNPIDVDDDEDLYDDDLEEEEDVDDFETDRELAAEQYDRLASLREPSPSGMLLFSADDPDHFDVLDSQEARNAEEALIDLSAPITSALSQYRTQFSQWELGVNPPESVINASILIDQCLAKFVYSLEPLKWIVDDLYQLGSLLTQFNSFVSDIHAKQQQSIETNTQLWNGLNRLSDYSNLVEDAFSDTSIAINELCDWVDGLLTPALAQVKFPTAEENSRVSQILDIHSYLCESLVKACTIIKIYQNCLKRIGCSLRKFQSILSDNDDIEDDSNIQFPMEQAMSWACKWTISLNHLINSLTVFHAISDCIQVHTSGHLSSLDSNNKKSTNDSADLVLPPTPPASSPNPHFLFPAHSVSYS